jgi:hypothetical protein
VVRCTLVRCRTECAWAIRVSERDRQEAGSRLGSGAAGPQAKPDTLACIRREYARSERAGHPASDPPRNPRTTQDWASRAGAGGTIHRHATGGRVWAASWALGGLRAPHCVHAIVAHVPALTPQRASILELFKPTLYCLTPLLIAPRVMLFGVTRR